MHDFEKLLFQKEKKTVKYSNPNLIMTYKLERACPRNNFPKTKEKYRHQIHPKF